LKFTNNRLLHDYKELNKRLKKKVKQRIKEFEQDLAVKSKSNPKRVYAYINNKIKVKDTIRAIQLKDGTIATNGKVITNTLNEFFASVFTKSEMTQSPTKFEKVSSSCTDPQFSETIIEYYLNKLDTNKAIELDKVHPRVLRECSKELAKPLSIIFNKSFQSGTLPNLWSRANIIPLFKKGNKLDPSNYRPVSLTSVVCKTTERIVRDKMMQYLKDNNLINANQHGFVNIKNCVSNLLEAMDYITSSIAEGWALVILFLDFAKAFDSVDHEKLLIKLQSLGFESKVLEWCKGFLKNRKQRVVLGEFESEWEDVVSGVHKVQFWGLFYLLYLLTTSQT
jgi:hypothetical protein